MLNTFQPPPLHTSAFKINVVNISENFDVDKTVPASIPFKTASDIESNLTTD